MVPAHYRSERIDFLDPIDDFAGRFEGVQRADSPAIDLPAPDGRVLLVSAAP